jgi:hypothetical protein
MVDTPAWLANHSPGGRDDAASVQRRLWLRSPERDHIVSQTSSIFEATSEPDEQDSNPEITVTHPLLAGPDSSNSAHTTVIHAQNIQSTAVPTINLATLLRHPHAVDIRTPIIIVCCAMVGQQLSGECNVN